MWCERWWKGLEKKERRWNLKLELQRSKTDNFKLIASEGRYFFGKQHDAIKNKKSCSDMLPP